MKEILGSILVSRPEADDDETIGRRVQPFGRHPERRNGCFDSWKPVRLPFRHRVNESICGHGEVRKNEVPTTNS